MAILNGLFFSAFAVVASGFLLYAESFWWGDFQKQAASAHYPVAEGTVLTSKTVEKNQPPRSNLPRNKIVFTPYVEYRYNIGSSSFICDRFRYTLGLNRSGDDSWAQSVANKFPPGSKVHVSYNPANPSEAVLDPGLGGTDVSLLLAFVPFNCGIAALWLVVLSWARQVFFKPVAGGVCLRKQGNDFRMRLPRFRPILIALAFIGAASFIALFGAEHHGTIGYGLTVWSIVIGLTLAVYTGLLLRIRSGAYDMIIETGTNTIILPKMFGRNTQVRLSFKEVKNVWSEHVEQRNNGLYSFTYAPTLRLHDNTDFRVANWRDRDKAESFSIWLAKQITVPVVT